MPDKIVSEEDFQDAWTLFYAGGFEDTLSIGEFFSNRFNIRDDQLLLETNKLTAIEYMMDTYVITTNMGDNKNVN